MERPSNIPADAIQNELGQWIVYDYEALYDDEGRIYDVEYIYDEDGILIAEIEMEV